MAKSQDWEGIVFKFDTPTDGVNYGIATHNRVWDTGTLNWVSMTQPGGSGGGGTQYAQGTTVATPTGTVAMAQNPSNVLSSLKTDSSGNLNVNLAAGSISGGNAAAGATGSAVPASAGYTGWNSGGNLVGASLTNALPVQPGTGASFPVTGTFWQATQPVSIASMPSTPVTGTFWQATQPVSGTVAATQSGTWNIGSITTLPAISGSVSVSNFPASQAVTGTFWQATQPVSIATMPSTPVTGTFWQATQPVSVAATVATQETRTSTSAVTSVSASVTTGTLLALNANRRQAMIYNDSTANLYLKFGATASTTSFTIKIAGGGYYELPQPIYTGVLDGIWDSATGAARITELI